MAKTHSSFQPLQRNSFVSEFDKNRKTEVEPVEVQYNNPPVAASIQFWDRFNKDLYTSVVNERLNS